MGTRAERTHGDVAGPRLATKTGGVLDERGRQSDNWQTPQPYIRTQINRGSQTQSGREHVSRAG